MALFIPDKAGAGSLAIELLRFLRGSRRLKEWEWHAGDFGESRGSHFLFLDDPDVDHRRVDLIVDEFQRFL